MKISTSAKTYADSLIQADNNYETILKDLELVNTVESKDFTNTMNNPIIQDEIKFEIIDEIFKNRISKTTINFLKVLISKKRFHELNEIIQAYIDKVDEINEIKRIKVISAIDLNEDQKSRIVEKLQNKLQKKVIANWVTNEDIIGGLIIKIDDNVIDSSLKNKLDKLCKILR